MSIFPLTISPRRCLHGRSQGWAQPPPLGACRRVACRARDSSGLNRPRQATLGRAGGGGVLSGQQSGRYRGWSVEYPGAVPAKAGTVIWGSLPQPTGGLPPPRRPIFLLDQALPNPSGPGQTPINSILNEFRVSVEYIQMAQI